MVHYENPEELAEADKQNSINVKNRADIQSSLFDTDGLFTVGFGINFRDFCWV